MTKNARRDIVGVIEGIRLVLLDSERERPFLNRREKAALGEIRAMLRQKLIRDVLTSREAAIG